MADWLTGSMGRSAPRRISTARGLALSGRSPSPDSCSRSPFSRSSRTISGSIISARSPPFGHWRCSCRASSRSAFGRRPTEVLHVLLLDYLPFIILLFTLFVVAGGISVGGNLVGTPATNTAILAFGSLLASFLGTTGASMVLIRPMIRANQDRAHKTHVFVFFIFLVVQYRRLADPARRPAAVPRISQGRRFPVDLPGDACCPCCSLSGVLLALFYVIDRLACNREPAEPKGKRRGARQLRIDGPHNVLYLLAVALHGSRQRHLEPRPTLPSGSASSCRSTG